MTLRPDNADQRLTPKAYEIGAASEDRNRNCLDVQRRLEESIDLLKNKLLSVQAWRRLLKLPASKAAGMRSAFDLLAVGDLDVSVDMFYATIPGLERSVGGSAVAERLRIEALYEAAVAGQRAEIEEVRKDEALSIPAAIDYNSRELCLSFEDREKLGMVRPQTVRSGPGRRWRF